MSNWLNENAVQDSCQRHDLTRSFKIRAKLGRAAKTTKVKSSAGISKERSVR